MKGRYFQIINWLLLFLTAVVLAVDLVMDASSAIPVKEVRHELAGRTEVERCVSCHAPESHPLVKGHDILAEACTPCHNGMGRGITAETAHMADEELNSDRPGRQRETADPPDGIIGDTPDGLFSGSDISAGCIRCHPPQKLAAGAPAAHGWRLFGEHACGSCHKLDQVSAGVTGLDLSHIGDIRSKEALAAQLAKPQASGLYSVMPDYPLRPERARKIALFLKGQSKLYLRPTDYRVEAPMPEDLVAQFACTGCHKYQGGDGGVAPDLDLVVAMRAPEWVGDFLRSPEMLRPGARMPALGKTEDARRVAATLMGTGSPKFVPRKPEANYEHLCARCHGPAGDGAGPIALNLATPPRRFSQNVGYFRITGWKKLETSIKNGIAGTAMPPLGSLLSDSQTNDLLSYVLRLFVGIGPNETVMDIRVLDRPEGKGEDGSGPYGSMCAGCHGEQGDRAVRMVHKRYPQPRNLRNRTNLAAVSDEQLFRAIARGVPGTRMKAYQTAVPGTDVRVKGNLKDGTIWELVAHVRRLGDNE